MRRRRGPKHPGVVLVRPEVSRPHVGWRARWRDPDSGKTVKVSLDKIDSSLTTDELREKWAARKSKELAKRRMELEGGAPRATGTPLADALDRYFTAHPQLRDRTLTIYRTAADKLNAWGGKVGVRSADDVTRARLMTFRERLIAEPKRVAVEGGKRGARAATGGPRSPAAVNQDLRSLRTVLGYLRDLDLFPKLTHDDLRRALKRLPGNTERAEYLKAHDLQNLIEAALRHDAETFTETRDEHAGPGRRSIGSTPRYEPIAPLVAFVLLTGMRFGEAITVTWRQVDLDAIGHGGEKVGEINLKGAGTKTRKGRTVDLEVSPALRSLLAALHLVSGGKGRVFQLSRATAEAAAKRLRNEYGAPEAFTWQLLRSSCACFLTNAPGIFGAASAYRSAAQLGHSVQVAQGHYLDVVKGIPRDARTLEAAMQIETELGRVISRVGKPFASNVVSLVVAQ